MSFIDQILASIRSQNHQPHSVTDFAFTCSTCGERHEGLMDLATSGPAPWVSSDETTRAKEFKKSDDLCVWNDEHYFVRGVLPIPVLGLDDCFCFGVWSSLSRENFRLYIDHWKDDKAHKLGPWFGWFSNSLKGYQETLNLKCQVHPQKDGQRPQIELEPTDHPLAVEQRDGITVERLLDIYANNNHRPS